MRDHPDASRDEGNLEFPGNRTADQYISAEPRQLSGASERIGRPESDLAPTYLSPVDDLHDEKHPRDVKHRGDTTVVLGDREDHEGTHLNFQTTPSLKLDNSTSLFLGAGYTPATL
jgi:hypothetical protein